MFADFIKTFGNAIRTLYDVVKEWVIERSFVYCIK